MDYINRYNLTFNVKHQTISIEHQDRVLTIKMDADRNPYTKSIVPQNATFISHSLVSKNPSGGSTAPSSTDAHLSVVATELSRLFLPSITDQISSIHSNMIASCTKTQSSCSVEIEYSEFS